MATRLIPLRDTPSLLSKVYFCKLPSKREGPPVGLLGQDPAVPVTPEATPNLFRWLRAEVNEARILARTTRTLAWREGERVDRGRLIGFHTCTKAGPRIRVTLPSTRERVVAACESLIPLRDTPSFVSEDVF